MKSTLLALGLGVIFASPGALAGPVYSYSASGTAGDGSTLSGTALLTFNDALSELTIGLDNTFVPGKWSLTSILTNFEFDQLDGVTFALTGATAAGTATCADQVQGNYTCAVSAGSVSDAGSWGWGTAGSSSTLFQLAAGGATLGVEYWNYGIVNDSVKDCTGASDCDGLSNSPHKPYLLGPVDFTFSVTGLSQAPTFENVKFSFGTRPDFVPGEGGRVPPEQIPEPQSLLLLALGLLGLGLVRRRAVN